jgi:hypothetical protein
MVQSNVIEPSHKLSLEMHTSSSTHDDAQKMRADSQCHEIHDRGIAAFCLEFGLEDQRAGAITPTDRNKRLFRSNQPPAGFSAPEQGSKACGRIETRPAKPIDRAIAADQSRGLAIADQRVILDP